jgi:hypothetical protein
MKQGLTAKANIEKVLTVKVRPFLFLEEIL